MESATTDNLIISIKEWLQTGSINIFGYPFAGKDTQGGFLAEALGAPLIGGGDILRNGTGVPQYVKDAINSGKLAPTEAYMQIVLPYLAQAKFSGQPLILSSVGRWSGEELGVVQAAAEAGHPIKAVLFLNLDERKVWQRFEESQRSQHQSRGKRHDDAADKIETRLEEFRVKTLPVISFYRSQGVLIETDSDRPIPEVQRAIMEGLAAMVGSRQ